MPGTCVVTGAGRGLGRLIAERFARKGWAVLCTDIDGVSADDTARAIGNGAWAIVQDVRDPDGHRRVAEEAQRRGSVGVWVNNAGVANVGPSWELDDATVRRIVEVNLLGVIHGSHAAVGVMRERGGTLINVGSLSSVVPAPGLAVYAATKHAVLGFTVALKGDLRRAKVPIHCAVICPDAMETDMVKNVAHRDEASILFASGKNMLRAEDVADEVAALADHPKLVTILPRGRGVLAQVFKPFPELGLKVLEKFAAAGRKVREKRGLAVTPADTSR